MGIKTKIAAISIVESGNDHAVPRLHGTVFLAYHKPNNALALTIFPVSSSNRNTAPHTVLMETPRSHASDEKQIIIYKTQDGHTQVDVRMDEHTVWLTAHQMAKLFGVDRTGIVRHMHNIYKTQELKPKSTCANIAQVAKDGRVRNLLFVTTR